MSTIASLFAAHEDDFLRWDDVPPSRRRSTRPDIHVFIILAELSPGTFDMVSAAEHDEIWLEVDPERIDAVAHHEALVDCIRGGLRYDRDTGSFCMFV